MYGGVISSRASQARRCCGHGSRAHRRGGALWLGSPEISKAWDGALRRGRARGGLVEGPNLAFAARVYPYRFITEIGGPVSYGADNVDQFRRAPAYVDRILKGEKPGSLPAQAPTKFHLAIN